jgi:hypothetical protein
MIRGRVADRAGVGQPGFVVRAINNLEATVATVETDIEGRFELEVGAAAADGAALPPAYVVRFEIARPGPVVYRSNDALEADGALPREFVVRDDGEIDEAIPFIQARHYKVATRQTIDLVVLHTMEAWEKPAMAEAVARWFAGAQAPQASAHYCVDRSATVQCVQEKDIAWHAAGANHNGIGIEHAGYAQQTPADWCDDYSERMLARSARLVADICARYSIPVEPVDDAGLLNGKRGITTHAAVSRAFKKSTHTDPGPSFPMTHYLDLVRKAGAGPAEDPPAPRDWEDYAPGSGKPEAGQVVPPEVIASIQNARATIPREPGLVSTTGGHFYMGTSDSSHLAYLVQLLDGKAAAAARLDQLKLRSFKALLRREGTTAAINTYDNQIVTWGTGWGGKGQLASVMNKATAHAPLKKIFRDCGLSYVNSTTYHVMDVASARVVSGRDPALQVVRGSMDLLYLLIHAARAPGTRDAVTGAQLDTFLNSSANIDGAGAIHTQALFNFVVHLKHWAPAYVSGVMAWALPQVAGESSDERDRGLAPLFGRFFYGRANKMKWKPSWQQFKLFWAHMKIDGLDCSGDPFIQRPEPPTDVPAGV